MAETLGSLCDKLTVVKIKQFHVEDETRKTSLLAQEKQLIEEIDCFIKDAISGAIPPEKLTFASNKVFKAQGNETREVSGPIGRIFSELSTINCLLWHEQEKVYDFESVPLEQKDGVIKRLAILNLERNKCIDELNNRLYEMVGK
jgi:hypothetical protein